MREELHLQRRQAQQIAMARAEKENPSDAAGAPMQGVEQTPQATAQGQPTQQLQAQQRPMSVPAEPPRTTWETVEEIVQMLKTAFPLLSLSIETMIEQILAKFKPNAEEDIYRHVSMLYADALQVHSNRSTLESSP
jgi:transformation/transcription domain-associated protein